MSVIPEHWKALCLAAVAVILSLTTWFSATAILPELIEVFKLTTAQSSWLTNAVQVGFVAGALTSSLLSISDVLKLTKLMATASLVAALSNALLLTEPTGGFAMLLRFMTGVSLAFIYPPAMKFIATWFVKGRGLAMGAMVGALTLGSALPFLFRGDTANIDWRLVIIGSSACSFIAAIIFGFLLSEGPHSFAKTKFNPRQLGQVVKNRPVMLANFGYFGHMWELYAMWGWLLAYITAAQSNGLEVSNAAFLTFSVVALGAPGCVFCGWLADKIGRCYATSIMMICSGSAALLVGFYFDGPVWVFTLVAMVWGFTVVADSAQFSAAVTELSDSSLVGSSLALQMGIGFAITIFAIWITPQVAQWLGSWQWTFLILVPGPFMGTWAMLKLRQHPDSVRLAAGKG